MRVIMAGLMVAALLAGPAFADDNSELGDGRWFTLYDEDHQVLLRTGIRIQVGDRFLSGNNRMYEVYRVDESRLRAWAKEIDRIDDLGARPVGAGIQGADRNRIGVYHTHSGESYLPSDGVESTDQQRGGVYQVGAQFSQRLEKNGVQVMHSQATHFPYTGSYRRSRQTALQLVEEGLDAIFDIHRDAAPWGEYFEEVEDMVLTQILLVVGTQNPAYRANEEFAWRLKAVSDRHLPDLVKGVFYAQGDYNQDLHARSLLLEIGAHTNRREHAEVGARAFADMVAISLYGAPDEPGNDPQSREIEENPQLQPTTDPPAGRRGGLLRGVLTLFGLLGFGGAAYMFIAVGSWEEVRDTLTRFWHTEFRDLTGKIPWEKLSPRHVITQIKSIRLGEGKALGIEAGAISKWFRNLFRPRNRL